MDRRITDLGIDEHTCGWLLVLNSFLYYVVLDVSIWCNIYVPIKGIPHIRVQDLCLLAFAGTTASTLGPEYPSCLRGSAHITCMIDLYHKWLNNL